MRFGILMGAPPGRAPVRYRFSGRDTLWLARYLAAAGARAPGQRRQLAWRAIQYFVDAGGRHGYTTFSDFIQRRAPSIPRAPWQTLPPRARAVALAATTGRLAPPPGNQRVFVKPAGVTRGAYAPAPPRWGQSEYEYEDYEAAPGDTPPPNAGDTTPPPQSGTPNGTQPPVNTSDTADIGDGAPDGEPPVEEPAGPPEDFNTADGNTLSLTPQLIQQLLATLRRHPRSYWQRKYPWLRNAFSNAGTSGWQPWSGRQWTGRGWTTRPWSGRQRSRSVWSGRPWRGRPGVVARSHSGVRSWRGRPLISRATVARPSLARRPIVQRMRQLARSSRKIGTLRSRSTGRRYPVFGARSGGRNYRIVTRPRRGMQHEIVLVRSGPLAAEHEDF